MKIDIKWLNTYLDSFGYRGRPGSQMKRIANQIRMASGGKMSVQASQYHYAIPRTDTGPYTAVEIGFPEGLIGQWEALLEPYDDGGSGVYGYVPIEHVVTIINENGGIIDG